MQVLNIMPRVDALEIPARIGPWAASAAMQPNNSMHYRKLIGPQPWSPSAPTYEFPIRCSTPTYCPRMVR